MHTALQRLEEGLKGNHTAFTPNTICANAALTEALRFGTGASKLAAHIPALHKLTGDSSIPICDGVSKSGGTLMKTAGSCAAHPTIGVSGLFPTNILGNRDGEMLHVPSSLQTPVPSCMVRVATDAGAKATKGSEVCLDGTGFRPSEKSVQ